MPVDYILTRLWQWVADQGITLAILFVIALLIPRIGRFMQRLINNRIEESEDADEGKARLAMVGVAVYVGEMIAYFLLIVFLLQAIGFSLAGAAIPATVVSAAVGFGAQSIIADFLAGFLILSEKQYGVGDWVRFEGNGVTVEGTVIQITMRATRIRTLAHETVIVPNSAARVSINTSNYWSRAVVVIPVPLLGSHSPQEAVERSEGATRHALTRPDVASELIGELDVHPAVGVNPPTVVGMPWTVDMRFMIQVKAGSQWLVERAIRTSILAEFWDEYGSATTVTGEMLDQVHTAELPEPSASAVLPGTERHEAPTERIDHRDGADRTEQFRAVGSKRTDEAPVPPEYADEEGRDPAVIEDGVQVTDRDPEDPEGKRTDGADDEDGIVYETRWQQLASVNGRVRPSTTYLFAALFALLILRGLTLDTGENWEGSGGILAPRDPGEETTQTPTPTPTPEPAPSLVPTPETTFPDSTRDTTTPQGTATQPQDTDSPQGTATQPQGTQSPQSPRAPGQTGTPPLTGEPAPTGGAGNAGTVPQNGGPEAASTPDSGQGQTLN